VMEENLSVRDLEKLLKNQRSEITTTTQHNQVKLSSIQMVFIEELEKRLASSVNIQKNNKGQGKLIVTFKSDDDFKRIVSLLNGE
jgi:hypothetical protein